MQDPIRTGKRQFLIQSSEVIHDDDYFTMLIDPRTKAGGRIMLIDKATDLLLEWSPFTDREMNPTRAYFWMREELLRFNESQLQNDVSPS